MNRVLKIALTASLLCPPAMATPSAGGSQQRTGTDLFLSCLLGFGPAECDKNNAFVPQPHARLSGDGPLEKVTYLGTNASGAKVYEVRFRYADSVAVISPPDPDGKVRWYSRTGNPNGMTRSPLTGVPAGTVPVSIYVRPKSAPGGSYARASGHGVDYGPAYGPAGYPLSPGDTWYDSGRVQSGMPLPSVQGPPQ